VAEARGFIAGSSRILTALDNVPKGVVPASARAKPRNWAAWRAAAAVLVVALGSFAVLRERMGTRQTASEIAPALARNPTADLAADSAPAAVVPGESSPANDASASNALKKSVAPTRVVSPPAFGKIASEGGLGREKASAPTAVSQPPAAMPDTRAERRADNATAQSAGAATMKAVVEPLAGRVAGVASSARAGAVVMSDAAAGPTSIRVVGSPRVIGEKRTLYEIGPGDTVLLAETLSTQLESVVVTGVGTARIAQSADTSTAKIQRRGTSAKSAATDSQRSNAAPSPTAAPFVAAPAPPAAVEAVNGITTLTWTDPASGNTMKLSGKHSAAELIEIRRRIEQLRAADAAAKKNP